MDLQLFLAVNLVAVSAIVMLLALVLRVPGALGWIVVNALVVAVGGLALALEWPWAGAITAAIFMPLVMVPALANNRAIRCRLAQKLPEAARYARLAAIFHPTADTRFNAALVAALALDEPRQTDAALLALAERAAPPRRCVALAQRAVVTDDWSVALALSREEACAAALVWLEIRALGALGRLDEMVAAYERHRASLIGPNLLLCQLFVLAFTGRRQGVEHVLAQIKILHADNAAFWRAIAALAGAADGEAGATARAGLVALAQTTRLPGLGATASRHATDGVAAAAILAAPAQAIVDGIETRLERDAARPRFSLRRSPVTLVLVGLNLAAFAAEIWYGGSEDTEALVTLGAMWPPLVVEGGEWWRLASAPFLHFGPLHLAANMVMLVLLGTFCEVVFGWRATLIAYLVGAVGSSAAVLGLMYWDLIPYGLFAGASGGVFTLFGLLFAYRARRWSQTRDVLDKQPIVVLSIAVAVQFAIDMTLPQVSLAAHAAGFAIGLAVGWPLVRPVDVRAPR